MEPSVQLQIGPSGVTSVRIHGQSEGEEKASFELYERIRPVISFTKALLLSDPLTDKPGQDGKAEPQA